MTWLATNKVGKTEPYEKNCLCTHRDINKCGQTDLSLVPPTRLMVLLSPVLALPVSQRDVVDDPRGVHVGRVGTGRGHVPMWRGGRGSLEWGAWWIIGSRRGAGTYMLVVCMCVCVYVCVCEVHVCVK